MFFTARRVAKKKIINQSIPNVGKDVGERKMSNMLMGGNINRSPQSISVVSAEAEPHTARVTLPLVGICLARSSRTHLQRAIHA